MRKTVTLIKKIALMVFFLDLVFLFATGAWAENKKPTTQLSFLQDQGETAKNYSQVEETPITDQEEVLVAESKTAPATPEEKPRTLLKFNKDDFENSVCFRRCHQLNNFTPSEKTEQQWRMLIEKNGHDIFKKIVWESPDQKEQTLFYLINHAGSPGDEGIGVWH